MSKVNILVDLENSEILTKEVEEVVKKTIERRCRDYVQSIVDSSIEKRISDRIKQWCIIGWNGKNKLCETIDKRINDAICTNNNLNSIVEDELTKFLNGNSLKDYIDKHIEENILKSLSDIFKKK